VAKESNVYDSGMVVIFREGWVLDCARRLFAGIRVVVKLLKPKFEVVDFGAFGCDENALSVRRQRNIERKRKVKLIYAQRHVTSIKYFDTLECTRHDVPACVSLPVRSARHSIILHKLWYYRRWTQCIYRGSG
jgi:hypothetical protein